jgi:endo-1,4-beta-xylanase
MIKFSRNRLISRRRILQAGIATVTVFTILVLSEVKVLTYLIYTLSNYNKIKNNRHRTFKIIGKSSLKKRARIKGIIYGSVSDGGRQNFEPDLRLQSHFIKECAMMTVGCYWTITRPTSRTFDFSGSDYFVEFASKNKLLLRGHPLVWHESLPNWVLEILNSENAMQILAHHIETTVRRYAGKMHSWDVVNEAINIEDKRTDGLRNTPWLKFLGADYIDLAFQLAAQADPQAKLVYNEYGVEYDRSEDEAKRQALLSLLQNLKSKGTPIYALGIQSHLSGDFSSFNQQKFSEFLKDIASLSLKIMITEMDVADDMLPLEINNRDRIIAGIYEDYLSVALAEKAVISVTTWGLSDRYTWLNRNKPRADKAFVRPLPLDRNMNHKLAWNAIARAFDRAPKR